MRVLIAAAAIVACTSGAAADTISVRPGLWQWELKAVVGPAPITQSGTECVAADEASISFEELAADLNNACTVARLDTTPTGVSFSLVCSGDVPGQIDGVFDYSDDAAKLNAAGEANLGGAPAPLSVDANATRLGAC